MKIKKGDELTAFEWQVLSAALQIPFGETRSYKWVAERIGKPKAVRAVGQALKKNPFAPLIPCHRVVKSDGQLGGYAGKMDNPKKVRLLKIEKDIRAQLCPAPGYRKGR